MKLGDSGSFFILPRKEDKDKPPEIKKLEINPFYSKKKGKIKINFVFGYQVGCKTCGLYRKGCKGMNIFGSGKTPARICERAYTILCLKLSEGVCPEKYYRGDNSNGKSI